MAWRVDLSDAAIKQLEKLGTDIEKRVDKYILTRIEGCENPRRFGKGLSGDKSAFWCYRVGDYRIICYLDEERQVVMVDVVGHRREIYDL